MAVVENSGIERGKERFLLWEDKIKKIKDRYRGH